MMKSIHNIKEEYKKKTKNIVQDEDLVFVILATKTQ